MAIRVPDILSQFEQSNEQRLLQAFMDLLDGLQSCFVEKRTFQRAKDLAAALLCSEAPHTLTNWLIASGKQSVDWSASYNFFSKACWEPGDIFDVVLAKLAGYFECKDFFAALDEVHLPKSGKKIADARYLRDPLGPAFDKGLHWALRFINCCALLTDKDYCSSARAVCIDFELAPPAKKPGKKATDQERDAYRGAAKECAISKRGAEMIGRLRHRMDATDELSGKRLVMAVDGGFTNKAVFCDIPGRTVVIGRIRKDACLYALPPEYSGKGRRRKYGERLPTPEQIRKAPCISWQECDVWAAGKVHRVRYKDAGPVLWKIGAKDRPVRLLIIEPLAYRPSKRAKLQYRDPAYLAVSDVDYSVEDALQCYFHRWQIEVSHRDAKSIVGVGDAQVRNPASVHRLPSFGMAVYSLILLAGANAYGSERTSEYGIAPKWRNDKRERASTKDIIGLFRQELQQAGMKSFGGFVSQTNVRRTPQNAKQSSIEISKTAGVHAQMPTINNCLKC